MYKRNAEPATRAFVIRVICGASLGGSFPFGAPIRNWQAGSSTLRLDFADHRSLLAQSPIRLTRRSRSIRRPVHGKRPIRGSGRLLLSVLSGFTGQSLPDFM